MQKQTLKKLIFIYNANAGKHNALFDVAHKILSPTTYNCNLCDITFGLFKENKAWKKYRKASNTPIEFLHKDEYTKMYASKFGYKITFPSVLAETDYALEVFINTDELNSLEKVEDLMQLIEKRLN
jgi:hypothetical protein